MVHIVAAGVRWGMGRMGLMGRMGIVQEWFIEVDMSAAKAALEAAGKTLFGRQHRRALARSEQALEREAKAWMEAQAEGAVQ